MKCAAYIDPKTGIALEGEALVNASKNPDAPRCGHELEFDDVFCPSCGAPKTVSQRQFIWDGRATRKEYWKTILKILGAIVLIGIFAISAAIVCVNRVFLKCVFIATFLSSAILGLCTIPVSVRRLHDLGFSGVLLLPSVCIGVISVFVFDKNVRQIVDVIGMVVNLLLGIPMGFMRGTKGPNKYGPDPLA